MVHSASATVKKWRDAADLELQTLDGQQHIIVDHIHHMVSIIQIDTM